MNAKIIKYLVGAVFFILTQNNVFAQQPDFTGASAKATADSSAIKIGEQFHLNLTVEAGGGLQLVWAEIPDSFDHFLVVDRGNIDTLARDGKNIYQQKLTLTSFDSGYWQIPAFHFKTVSGDTTIAPPSLTTDSFLVQVNTVPVDTTKPFNPIKQIRSVPFNILAYWPYLLGGLIALLILLYFIFFRKKKVKRIPEKVIPAEPPYEQALRNLQLLEKEKLWQQGDVKAYYTRLTDILRLYIERAFNINAMEQTTDELLSKIKPVTKLNQQQDNLRSILQTADLAKFAKLQPLPEEHEANMRRAYEILEWTRPRQEDNNQEEDKRKKTTTRSENTK